ncbi:MAG TPA: alpha-amylase family protein [Bryobacteraceae bacterium]|nr:alpha-amylase family protein [Bryobacteraceae bacterium]
MAARTARYFFACLLALAAFQSAPPVFSQASLPVPDKYIERQKLLDEIAWPSHEPLMFLRRHGGMDVDAESYYFRYHTEENVRKIAATGLEMSRILHFYKGFGFETEQEEMQRTVELARLFHKYNMKVPVYIGGTMFSETFFLETPEARKWVRVDQWGQPVTYGSHQTARYFACLNNPGYVEYLKKVLKKATVEVKADRVFFDNFTLYAEPQSCHNEACVREFRRYLSRKYDADARVRRFGFASVEGIHPPIWNVLNEPWQLETISDPLLQEWIDFRCWTISNYYRQLYDYMKSLNPGASVGVNIKGVMGRNRAFRDGIDHPRFADVGDWFELDPGFAAGISENGSLVSEIRSYKIGQSLGVPFDFEAETELRLAEYMAFNFQKETLGFGTNGGFREFLWVPHLFRYFDFFKENDQRFYRGAQSVGDVAVLRGYASMANNNDSAHRATVLAEQLLIQGKIPFHIIFDRHLPELSKYKVLMLTEQESLSDSDIEKIKGFVERGGGLVATGAAGDYDQWRRPRLDKTLAAALGFRKGKVTRGTFGKGRFVYLPAISPATDSSAAGNRARNLSIGDSFTARGYRDFTPEQWLLPKNRLEILDALRWAAAGRFSAEIQAPLTTVAELTQKASDNVVMLHLLNYDERTAVPDVQVDLAVPRGRRVKSVTLLSPDADGTKQLEYTASNGRVRFKVPKLAKYSLAVVGLTSEQ